MTTDQRPEDRRDLPRWHLDEDATLILDDHYDVRCPLRDVSGSGIAMTTDLRPDIGDEAIIYVRALGRFRAKVARVAQDHVALRFMVENERQIVLLQRLERRLADQYGPSSGSAEARIPDPMA